MEDHSKTVMYTHSKIQILNREGIKYIFLLIIEAITWLPL